MSAVQITLYLIGLFGSALGGYALGFNKGVLSGMMICIKAEKEERKDGK